MLSIKSLKTTDLRFNRHVSEFFYLLILFLFFSDRPRKQKKSCFKKIGGIFNDSHNEKN